MAWRKAPVRDAERAVGNQPFSANTVSTRWRGSRARNRSEECVPVLRGGMLAECVCEGRADH